MNTIGQTFDLAAVKNNVRILAASARVRPLLQFPLMNAPGMAQHKEPAVLLQALHQSDQKAVHHFNRMQSSRLSGRTLEIENHPDGRSSQQHCPLLWP